MGRWGARWPKFPERWSGRLDRRFPSSRLPGRRPLTAAPAVRVAPWRAGPSEDVEDTHGRWIEREPGIWERADWDEGSRTLSLAVRSNGGAAISFGLHWLSAAEWLRLLEEARLRVEAFYGWFDRLQPFQIASGRNEDARTGVLETRLIFAGRGARAGRLPAPTAA